MNLNTIQKNYGKLSTVERFKLLNLALARGDDADLTALQQSAPRKTWAIPTTRGLVEAFEFLSFWHIMTMQETNALFHLLEFIGDGDYTIEGYSRLDLLAMIRRRTLARDAAWREVCKEYGIDPDELTGDLPGAESVRFFVDVMKRYNELVPVDVDSAEYIADLRGVIEHYREQWE